MNTDSVIPLAHPIPAACKRLGIGRTMLYALIARGQIRTVKLGIKTLIPDTECVRIIAEGVDASPKARS